MLQCNEEVTVNQKAYKLIKLFNNHTNSKSGSDSQFYKFNYLRISLVIFICTKTISYNDSGSA